MFLRTHWIGISVLLVALCAVGVFLLRDETPKEPIKIYKPVQPLEKQTAQAPVAETPQGGHWHGDEWHAEPHEAEVEAPQIATERVSNVSTEVSTPSRVEYDTGAGNPPPWEHVPVDLWDFEATKAAMIENINFVKANWDPKVYNREVSIANAISHNIANAAMSGIYTDERGRELNGLYSSLLQFKGVDVKRVLQLEDEGHATAEAIRIAAEERLARWGVK